MIFASINYNDSILKDIRIEKEGSGLKLFPFKGMCMRPLLKMGDILLVKSNIKIKPGDILVYSSANGKIAHRLLDIRKVSNDVIFVMHGDSSYDSVDLSTQKDTIGKVAGFMRNKKIHRIDKGLYSLFNLFLAKLCILRYKGYKLWINIKQNYIKPFLALCLMAPVIKRVLLALLDSKYQPQIHSSNGNFHLIVMKQNMEIWRILLHPNNGLNGNWQMSAFWVWWPYRTLGLGRYIMKRAINLARKNKAIRIELLLRKNSFPMIGKEELSDEGFFLTKKTDCFLWKKDL